MTAEPVPTAGWSCAACWRRVPRPVVLIGLVVLVCLLAAVPGRAALSKVERARFLHALSVVSGAGVPASMQADPTLTFCSGFGALCAKTQLPPAQTVNEMRSRLGRAGVVVGATQCGDIVPSIDPMAFVDDIECVAVDTSLGRAVSVEASDRVTDAEGTRVPLGYTWMRVSVAWTPTFSDDVLQASAPLGGSAPAGVSDLSMLPAWMSRSAVCKSHTGAKCNHQEVTAPLPDGMTPDQAIDAVATSLTAKGYALHMRSCHDGAPDSRTCSLIGQRFVLPKGAGQIQVLAIISRSHARVMVTTP